MRTCRIGTALLATALLGMPGSAWAQAAGSIQLHNQINFSGRTYTVNGPRPNLRVPWQVRSVRIGRSGPWELCIRPNFSGCSRFDQDGSNIRLVVMSARPVPPAPPPPPGGGGGSLRGMASEYFPRPSDARGRVPSCPSGAAACAADSANRFCRSRGWVGASFHMQETVNRQNLLADVLCTRTGQ